MVLLAELAAASSPGTIFKPCIVIAHDAYRDKVRRLYRGLRAAARHPDTVVALFLDELGIGAGLKSPPVGPGGGGGAARGHQSTMAHYWGPQCPDRASDLPGWLRRGAAASDTVLRQLDHTYPAAELLYVIQDNWNIHTHPEVLTAVVRYPRIQPVWLPTYAPWLNPIEKFWRWVRQDILKMHRWVED